MNKPYKEELLNHVFDNQIKYILAVICIIAGLIGGIFPGRSAAHSSDYNYLEGFFSTYMLGGAAQSEIFLKSIIISLRSFGLIWLSGWLIWLVPLNYAELAAKGFGIGYSSAYLICSGGLKGFALLLSALLLQNIILIPALIVYSVIQINFAVKFDKVRRSPSAYKERRRLILSNMASLAVFLIPVCICGFIDAYIIPGLIKIIC